MNLFRSEEHVKNWASYDPISEESIMPLANWDSEDGVDYWWGRNAKPVDYITGLIHPYLGVRGGADSGFGQIETLYGVGYRYKES